MKLAANGGQEHSRMMSFLRLGGNSNLGRRAGGSDGGSGDGRHAANTLGLEGLAVAIPGLVGVRGVDDTTALAPGIVGRTTTATAALDELHALHVDSCLSELSGPRIRRNLPNMGPSGKEILEA